MIAKCNLSDCPRKETCVRWVSEILENQEWLNASYNDYLNGDCYWYWCIRPTRIREP